MNRTKCLFGGALLGAGLAASAMANPGISSHGKGPGNGPGKDYVVLWDQSTFGAGYGYADQSFGDYPAYSIFMVDDFTTKGETWDITSVHTYFTKGFGGWSEKIDSAMLQFYPKKGATPDNGADVPPEYKVPIKMIDHGTYWEAAATGLSIPELLGVNGDYWVGLTPNADFLAFGQEFHLSVDPLVFGDLGAVRNPGGGFGIGKDWVPMADLFGGGQKNEMAFLLDGEIVPAPGAAALLGLGGLLAGRRRR